MLRKILAYLYLITSLLAFYQCARRGTPTGGPKDESAPKLLRAEPKNFTSNFKGNKIKLYFDELVTLKDIQNQLIVSPPLKYQPLITPQGGASTSVEILLRDTLAKNTTYTLNFGQSITDYNEGNPSSFLSYVFSTGSYIDSLDLTGVVKDSYKANVDSFISVMLYKIDSSYTDSTVFKRPPNYITNTLDSAVIFNLKNLKKGKYALFALKDVAKNNIFNAGTDKIGFVKDTIQLPTDSTYILNLFKEKLAYAISVPSLVAKNRVLFGYSGNGGNIQIRSLTNLPDSVKTFVLKDREKDSLNYWFTPFDMDSILFEVTNKRLKIKDTFLVKNRAVGLDSLTIAPNQKGVLEPNKVLSFFINTPIIALDTTQIILLDKDSIPVLKHLKLDTIQNKIDLDFAVLPNEKYQLRMYPNLVSDIFDNTNDTLNYFYTTKSLADYGNLRLAIKGAEISYPIIVELLDNQETIQRSIYATKEQIFEFSNLEPSLYRIRIIYDSNKNKIWDTGNYIQGLQPERVIYYPGQIELRANWEKIEVFNLL